VSTSVLRPLRGEPIVEAAAADAAVPLVAVRLSAVEAMLVVKTYAAEEESARQYIGV
jgi:hypothetical protein